jgi:acetyl-CoA hydrolase
VVGKLALCATDGYACVDGDDIDVLVESDERVIDMPDPEPSAVERAVAEQVAALVPDRATVQLGVGTLPAAVARALSTHRELGLHSGVVSDVLSTWSARVVTNAQMGAIPAPSPAACSERSACAISPSAAAIDMRSADYTHNPPSCRLSRTFLRSIHDRDRLVGPASAEIAGGRYLGAVGGRLDFVRGRSSPGGRSIIAFRPRRRTESTRIVAALDGRP